MSQNVEAKKSGMATAALVLGIIGILLSFIPIINNVAFVLGVLAIIFGIIPLVKKASKGKAIAGLILGILAIVITLAMQSAVGKALDDTSKELDKMSGGSTEEVLKNEVDVTLGKFTSSTDSYGITDSKMTVTVKNKTKEKKSFTLHIEAIDSNGKRIEEDYVYANDLGAGQSQDFDIFTYVSEESLTAMQSAEFKIVEASSI